jgi:hypothetical protein
VTTRSTRINTQGSAWRSITDGHKSGHKF